MRQFEKWHGRLAREITRKMRGPPQTDPLPNANVIRKSEQEHSSGSRSAAFVRGMRGSTCTLVHVVRNRRNSRLCSLFERR